jgi:D-amino peptidase
MKVYISVDMEGLAGISHPGPTQRGDPGYAAAVTLMDGETNAAIAGAFDGGATDVLVNDSHGGMYNLTPQALDARARLLQGRKPLSMVEGAAVEDGPRQGQGTAQGGDPGTAPGFGVALFVGYHARAGHPRGTIAHTYTGGTTLTSLNGRPTGEYGINALYLGALGIPVAMVAGDDALAEEVEAWLPWAERVVVKRGVSRGAADSLHPEQARRLVREGAQRAVARAIAGGDGAPGPLTLAPPIQVGIEFNHAGMADFAAVIPGFQRDGDRGVRYTATDAIDAYRAFVSAVRMAGQADE